VENGLLVQRWDLSGQLVAVEKSPNQLVVVDTMFFGGVAVTVCKRSAVEVRAVTKGSGAAAGALAVAAFLLRTYSHRRFVPGSRRGQGS
jgi:hypothetical protein